MLNSLALPVGVDLKRTTAVFTAATVPSALLNAHRTAKGVWGVLRVERGVVTFTLERSGESRRVDGGEYQVIEPDVAHRVEVDEDARFVIEFYR